jgi:hypothetical protein
MVRFFINSIQRFHVNSCLIIESLNPRAMSTFSKKYAIVLILVAGTFIGIFKGAEARGKYIFKVKNRYAEKKQLAEKKKLLRSGGVALDDIEMAAFHR